jgi:hypothetical protein
MLDEAEVSVRRTALAIKTPQPANNNIHVCGVVMRVTIQSDGLPQIGTPGERCDILPVDEPDNRTLECAPEARSDLIVSGDRDCTDWVDWQCADCKSAIFAGDTSAATIAVLI